MLYLPIAFALLGFIFSAKPWVKLMDKLNPMQGLIVYYTIIYVSIAILSYFGLIVGGYRITNITHTVGAMLILFSWFIIFDFESAYINLVTRGQYNTNDTTQIYLQSEDGAAFDVFYNLTNDIEKSRILTFVITPFVLTMIGSSMITKKISLY